MCLISRRVGDLNPFQHFFELPRLSWYSGPYQNFLVLFVLVTYTVNSKEFKYKLSSHFL